MRTKTISALAAGAGIALALTACGPAGQDGPRTSTPTFSTIPSTPLDTSFAEQTMRDFRAAHDHCGNAPTAGNAVDPVQCSRASGMMSTLPTPCISGDPSIAADVEKCAQALRGSDRPSAAPATATVPPLPPLHDDPTADMTDVAMIHAMNEALPRALTDSLDWKGARGMGSLVMEDYRARDVNCKATGDYIRDCAARDVLRSSLPSRCIVEAERVPARADGPGLCGVALLYVQHMPAGGGK